MPTLTAMTWYYRLFGEEFGPVPHEMLVTLLENGTLSPTDEVKAETGSHWLTLKEVLDSPQEQTLESASPTTHDGLGDAHNGWYCKAMGRELGPMGFDEIQSFVEGGQLGPDAEVKLGAAGKWRAVRSIGRLMAVLPFEKREHKIPEGRLSKEMPAISEESSRERESSRPVPKSRISDEFDDDDDDDRSSDGRRSRKKRRNRRGGDAQGYGPTTPPFGMPAFYPVGPVATGYGGFPAAPTPAYGMPIAAPGYAAQWPPAAVPAPAPVDHLWYAWIGGQEYGPVEYAQLAQWATAGQLASTDYVRQGQAGQYVLASNVNGLVPPPAPTPVIPAVTAPAATAPAVQVTSSEPKPVTTTTASSTATKVSETNAKATASASEPVKASVAKEAPATKTAEVEPVITKTANESPSVSAGSSGGYSSASSFNPGSSSSSYSSGGYGSSGFGAAAPSRPMPMKAAPKKKAAAERPEWLDDAIEGLKSPKALVAAGLLALVGLYFSMGLLPASTGSDRALQTKLETVLATVKKLRESKAGPGEWEALAQSTAKEYPKDFVDKLQSSASRKYPYKQLHLWCVRDRLQKMISNSRTKVSHEERDFENNLREAAKLLGMPTTIAPAPEMATAGGKPASGAQ